MDAPDGTEDDEAIVCWHCGALVPLEVLIIEGRRVVLCAACDEVNSLEIPSELFRHRGGLFPKDG